METFWKIFMLPSRMIVFTIPIVITLGLIVGLYVDTNFLKEYVLYFSMLVVFPMMIGIKLKEIVNAKYAKLINASLIVNFLFIPILGYILGYVFLRDHPGLFAGLAILSLLPTGTMTIGFTMLAKGNIPAAVQLSIVGLLVGAIVAPWYLLFMIGQYVPINIWEITQTIILIIFIPLMAGLLTYYLLTKKMTEKEFIEKIKPKLPGFSAYAMIYIIFTSISVNAKKIVADWRILLLSITVLLIFYIVVFIISYLVGKKFFCKEDTIPLVYSSALRNLSIALSLSVTTFGTDAAFIVALCFLFQQQFAVLFSKFIHR